MPIETTQLVKGILYALLFGLLGWAAFGGAAYGLLG